ncbi:MAG TPA: ABC transporter ATP-binding protein [Anaerolineaceae bacterium]|nr:ABC transporter ATP-binding protein [Anaerolineaceae bacterium]
MEQKPSEIGSSVTTQNPHLLEVRGLTRYFTVGSLLRPRHVHAVEDVSFAVRRGQVVALVGESGSGKSTTIRLVARLIEATRGEILFEGVDVIQDEPRQASREYRRKVQMIFQDPFASLNAVHTIEHHIERPLIIHKKAEIRAERLDQIHILLGTVGLNPPEEIARRYPHQLSGGQRQRVAIARALAVDPELILADEPISMLDVSIRMGVLNLIAQLKEERGLAFLYVTHDLASARYIGDEIIVMYAGRMVEGGTSEEVMQEAAHPYTRLLISAVPDPHAGLRTRKETGLRGEVPSLIDPPPGCPFVARCPNVTAKCHEAMPGVSQISPTHWARCYLY